MAPVYLDPFLAAVRDNEIAQVAIIAVLFLIVLDVVFGLLNAFMHKEYSSDKMRAGIAHKCAELGFILVGIVADATIIGGFDLGFNAPVLVSICLYLALMEIGSLMETFSEMNPELAHSPLFQLLSTVQDMTVESTDED